MWARQNPVFAASALAAALACASPQGSAPALPEPSRPQSSRAQLERVTVVRAAESVLGAPYRYGGRGPTGFDCSGLVQYSFARAGIHGLPRSAEALELAASPVELGRIRPGDLLFFRLDRSKTTHVAIYVGGRSFVHAPSRGKRVERIDFDHVYWGPRLARAGRLLE
jgi:cell wall-associated NlpC family hydrolase